jgi:hypothetical protein
MGANQSSEDVVLQTTQPQCCKHIMDEPYHNMTVQASQLVCSSVLESEEDIRIRNYIRARIQEDMRSNFARFGPISNKTAQVIHCPSSHFGNRVTRKILKEKELTFASCSICLQHYKLKQYIITIPQCGHIFHRDCSESWYQKYHNLTCPNCRSVAE